MNPGETNPPLGQGDLSHASSAAAREPEAFRLASGCDDIFYVELSRTNNELINLQREMARKNAELGAAQKKLEASEQRYRSLSACSPIGILEMDAAGRCLYTNPHWRAITGLTAEESLGDGWQRALESGDAPAVLEEWNLARRAGLEFCREFRFVTTGGEQRWAQIRSQAIRAERGEIAGHASTVEDITERKLAEAALEKAHREVVEISRLAGMAEIATNVLHNVGNVLNSVNVSSSLVADHLRKSKTASLVKVVALMREHEADLVDFLTDDPKGRQLPGYLAQLAAHLTGEQSAALCEMALLQKNVEHIKDIVAMQQSYARISGVMETLPITDLVEDALRMNAGALLQNEVQVVREFEKLPPLNVEKHKILQILVNLVRNAKHACQDSERADRRLTVRVGASGGWLKISVADNGVGIPPENLTRVFNHGFTTRKDGHGFGLHSGALAAQEMGGSLTVQSDGPGQGATFTLELPNPAPEETDE